MNIFLNIAYNNHYDTIREAALLVAQRASQLSLTQAPWSLVELVPDEEDFAWLCNWASALSPGIAKHCLMDGQWKMFQTPGGDFSYATAIGVLLLLSAVEVARRNASERSLWNVVSHSYFSEETRKVLFVQNYPVQGYKDAIELAVHWLKLRHVFGVEGLQNWYDTIYLQLGFTKLGFTSRLPEWLVGQNRTFAICHLLHGSMCSETFVDLWRALEKFRRKNITQSQLKQKVEHNPWILPTWIPELIQQAARIELKNVSSSQAEQLFNDDEGLLETFLEQPQFVWNTFSEPRFISHLSNISLLHLTEPVYSIMAANRVLGSIHRIADGTYTTDSADEIILPATTPLCVVSLIAPDGTIAHSQTLQLWNEGEDVVMFSGITGHTIDPWERVLSTQKSYFLLLAADLNIQPRPALWHHLTANTCVFCLEKGWSTQTQVLLEGHVLWEPRLSSAATPTSPQPKSDDFTIDLYDTFSPLTFEQEVRFQIRHSGEYTPTFLRCAGQAIRFEHHTSTLIVTQPVKLEPSMFPCATRTTLEFTIGFCHNPSQRFSHQRLQKEVPFRGVTILREEGWVALEANKLLNLEEARRQPMRFYLSSPENVPLLEGDTWIANTWNRPKPLQGCAGFGAPLKLQKSAYNAVALDEPLRVVDEVIHTGCIQMMSLHHEQDTKKRSLDLVLTRFIEPDPSHSIVWWEQDGRYTTLQPGSCSVREGRMYWSTVLPETCTHPLAVGVAYNGHWLGTWYSEGWADVLLFPSHKHSTIVALLRWFHLPLIGHRVFARVQRFAWTYAQETLSMWLNQHCPLPELQFTSGDDGWFSVVRAVFFDWQPEGDIEALLTYLEEPDVANHLLERTLQIITKLSRVNPILMAKIIFNWIQRVCIPEWGGQQASVLLQHLVFQIVGVSHTSELEQRKSKLVQELAEIMDVNARFIEKSLLEQSLRAVQGKNIGRIQRENIAVAMHVELFRRLQSAYLLEWMYKHISGR